ncbi:Rap1a/Tai family immunity protein [Serratia marcescens]|uniref:Rap1a/Tai family immunity protein n=1 Tax=Serratia marcescens TaxID=615 RepID=A0ABD5IEY0_SERMA|nr:Rap1a/Tai family immunity protein [Serratia marcescens]MDX7082500.1 Rap1a/Tai family immunity protein [Serratia marcescens]
MNKSIICSAVLLLTMPIISIGAQNKLVTIMYQGEQPLALARSVIEYDKKGDSSSAVDNLNNLFFMNYVSAILDDDAVRFSYEGEGKTYCPPTKSVGNLSVIGAKYLIEHPEERSIPTPLLLRKAWKLTYPCNSNAETKK